MGRDRNAAVNHYRYPEERENRSGNAPTRVEMGDPELAPVPEGGEGSYLFRQERPSALTPTPTPNPCPRGRGEASAAPARGKSVRERISPLVALLAAALLFLVLPPTLFLIDTSFHVGNPDGSLGAFTLQYYRQLFGSPYFATSLRNTAIYAIGTAMVAIVLGGTQALIVERTNAPGRGYVIAATILSLGVPHVLYVVAWLLLLGRAGPVN